MTKLFGKKKKGKKRGLGKVRPKHGSPPKKKKKGRRKRRSTTHQGRSTTHQGRFTIRQPRKKQYSVLRGAPRLVKRRRPTVRRPRPTVRRPRGSFKHMTFSDEESYSNIMGKEDLRRKIRSHKNIDGRMSGIVLDQDNELIRLNRYP